MPPRAVRSAGGGMGGRYLWTHRVNRRGWGSILRADRGAIFNAD